MKGRDNRVAKPVIVILEIEAGRLDKGDLISKEVNIHPGGAFSSGFSSDFFDIKRLGRTYATAG
jgi:hypothetical protein